MGKTTTKTNFYEINDKKKSKNEFIPFFPSKKISFTVAMLACERLRSASKKDKPGLETRIFVTRNIFCIINSAFINL